MHDSDPNAVADFDAALERLGGSQELLQDMMRFFREDVGPLLDKIEHGLVKGDAASTKLASHSIKGLAASFDAFRVADVSRQIECLSAEGDLAGVKPLLPALREQVSELIVAFDAYEA